MFDYSIVNLNNIIAKTIINTDALFNLYGNKPPHKKCPSFGKTKDGHLKKLY